jgi:hypothetical protein
LAKLKKQVIILGATEKVAKILAYWRHDGRCFCVCSSSRTILKQPVPIPLQVRLICHDDIFEVCLIFCVKFFMQMVLPRKMLPGEAIFVLSGNLSFDFKSY